jgi:hypothetical protein
MNLTYEEKEIILESLLSTKSALVEEYQKTGAEDEWITFHMYIEDIERIIEQIRKDLVL